MHQSANAASVAIFRGQEVLLIQRALPPLQGLWTLPGGRLEPGETIAECALREMREELGWECIDLLEVTNLQVTDTYLVSIFATYALSDTPVPSAEIADWCWVLPDAIGHLQTTPGLREVLSAAQKRLLHATR